MDYKLRTSEDPEEKKPVLAAFATMFALMAVEKKALIVSLVALVAFSLMNLLGPLIVGHAIDTYVVVGNFRGVLAFGALMLLIYLFAAAANYVQVRVMGAVGQRTLWRLRNTVFTKLQELPLSFFTQNKAGDLISRINNDTEKLNQFFSQSLMQFSGSALIVVGAGIFVLVINWRLGLAALAPALGLVVITRALSGKVGRTNLRNLQAQGGLSAEVQESMENFKVIIAFNRRDYFRKKFAVANETNYKSSMRAGYVNDFFMPIFDFAGNLAQLAVLSYGIYLIAQGQLAIGLLVSYLLYVGRFYDPLRSFASFWSTMQIALAGWDRISEILKLESDLKVISVGTTSEKGSDSRDGDDGTANSIMRFENVSFHYALGESGKRNEVLSNVSFNFEKGKTYALVGPTGGGKTTTASLMARLFDPTEGVVYLDGKDIRSYEAAERAQKIGFILQEPFLFTGTVKENILYGNAQYADVDEEKFTATLKKEGLDELVNRFEGGLSAKVDGASAALSLGQRQIIAFMRAILRKPDLLILDEATANIDTITEKILEDILQKLPTTTTKVIIAHRLNTIESADEIFFVNGAKVTAAGSMAHAVDMLLHNKRQS